MKEFAQTDVNTVREYWNSRPCNIRHSTKDVGTREYFDEVEARKYRVEPHIPGFADFAAWKGKKVLEIGCGIGTDTMNFARAGAIVTAVDYSDESLKVARQRAAVLGCDVTFYHANAEELSATVPVETYDLIYSFGVIHHTPHPEKVIQEICKYCGPHSTFKIMMYYRLSFKVLWILLTYGKMAFWKTDRLIATYSEAQTGCPVTYSYTKKSLANLLRGFRVEKFEIDHIFPYSIPHYKRYEYVRVWYFRIMPRFLFRILEKNFGWHLMATARPDGHSPMAADTQI